MEIGLEGGVCAGKTSIGHVLERAYGLQLCPEYWVLLTPEQRYAVRNLMSPMEALIFFLRMDSLRSRDNTDTNLIVLDRCILSILGHEFALHHAGLNSAFSSVWASLAHEPLIAPPVVYYLDVSDQVRLERGKARSDAVDTLFFDKSFNRGFRLFFERLSERIPVVFVDNDSSSPEERAAWLMSDVACLPRQTCIDRRAAVMDLFHE